MKLERGIGKPHGWGKPGHPGSGRFLVGVLRCHAGAGREGSVRLSALWRWEGEIDHGPYAVVGLVCFAIKHNLDRYVASAFFHRPWGIFNYWIPPGEGLRITSLPKQDLEFFGVLLAMALPFIWVGVVLTVQRLEGTTWYQHHLWPASYWQLWSDAIIHRIHLRVLMHIKHRAEAAPSARRRFNIPEPAARSAR